MINIDIDFARGKCKEALPSDHMLDSPAGGQHADTEYVGRMLQLPTVKTVASNHAQSDSELPVSDRSESQS